MTLNSKRMEVTSKLTSRAASTSTIYKVFCKVKSTSTNWRPQSVGSAAWLARTNLATGFLSFSRTIASSWSLSLTLIRLRWSVWASRTITWFGGRRMAFSPPLTVEAIFWLGHRSPVKCSTAKPRRKMLKASRWNITRYIGQTRMISPTRRIFTTKKTAQWICYRASQVSAIGSWRVKKDSNTRKNSWTTPYNDKRRRMSEELP